MKTLISFFFIMMMMLVACTKDQFVQEENLELKKAKVPVPLKADFCFTPNMEVPPMLIVGLPADQPTSYLPSAGWLSGHATHAGELQMMKSPMTAVSAHFDFEKMRVVWVTTGKNTAANGDYYFYDATSYSNPMDGTFTGDVYMRDGIGKFKGMTGTVQMVGQGTCWHAEGTMIYAR
jgi:uncharacterized GH25 family protein